MDKKDEISIKEFLLGAKREIIHLLYHWKIITIAVAIGVILGFMYAKNRKTRYIGELVFTLEDNKSNPLGIYAGIANQLGVDLASSGSSGIFSGDNVIGFLKSRFIIEKSLLSIVKIEGKESTLADFYLDFNSIRDDWKDLPQLKTLKFPPRLDRTAFSRTQDSVLNLLRKRLIKNELDVFKSDKKSSFITVNCISQNEIFAKAFVERLVSEATDFYIETKLKRSKANVDKLQHKADSLEQLLNSKTYSVAIAQDINQNPARRIATVGTELGQRDKIMYQTMYGEIVKNLELAKMTMAQEAPIIQIIDPPVFPLREDKLGLLKGSIFGGMLSGCFVVFSMLIRRIYIELMK